MGLIQSSGRTQARRYFVDPGLLRNLDFAGETTLKRIEPHRLAALILEDLRRYPESAIGAIRQRIGSEIHLEDDVRAWIDRLRTEVQPKDTQPAMLVPAAPRRRGRPTKAEQIARRRAAEAASR